jgi:HAE1 family hydrophobic/amphiphilic exporter-1
MGYAVIGGMTAATCIAIFIIPVSFYMIEKWSQRPASPAPAKVGQEQDHE